MQKGFCEVQPDHLPLFGQDPRRGLPITWTLPTLQQQPKKALAFLASSLLTHPDPHQLKFSEFFSQISSKPRLPYLGFCQLVF